MFQEINDPANYRAALYIRLSKEDEREGPSQSVTNQRSLLDEFVEKHHLQVYDIYVDDGWSGTNFDRPAFRRMIEDIEAKRVNMVITKDLSRLGRDYIMTGHYMERYFPEHRVRYISLLDGIDTGVESSANDITPFRAIMNDMYAKDISKKIKSVKRDKQRKGEFIGGKPVYGYKMHPTERNRIVIDEEAAPTVRRIFSMALEGVSCRKIAAALNEEGVPAPSVYCGRFTGNKGPYGGLWSGERISEMLRNETYIGSMVQGRQMKISYKSKKCLHQDRENWIVVPHTHAPLVDEEIFRKVGLLVSSRRHTRCRTYDFLLKGLIFCHECGYPLAVLNRPNVRGEDVLYFVCRTYQRFTRSGVCSTHYIKEKTVADAVVAKVREICKDCLNSQALLAMAEEAVRETSQENETGAEMTTLQENIADLTKKIDRMYTDRLSGLLPEADFQRIFTRLKDQRGRLEGRLQELEQEQKYPVSQRDRALELTRRYRETACTGRELLVSLIQRIELTEDREVLIQFRFAEPKKTDAITNGVCYASLPVAQLEPGNSLQ